MVSASPGPEKKKKKDLTVEKKTQARKNCLENTKIRFECENVKSETENHQTTNMKKYPKKSKKTKIV